MIPAKHIAPRDWLGETAVIVASGPSTELLDLTRINGHRVVAVAHGYRAVPRADVLVVGGRAFYARNNLTRFLGGLIIAAQSYPSWAWLTLDDRRIVYMDRAGPLGLADDPGALCGSESSVMLAINYAVHRGVSRIVLLGCDGKPGRGNRRRVGISEIDTDDAIDRYRKQEAAMASQIAPLAERGIEIVNATPGTALTIYPRVNFSEVF